MELLENPIFLLGIVAGLFLSFLFCYYNQERENSKMFSDAYSGKTRINNMISAMRSGQTIDLSDYYKQPRRQKGQRSLGYLAWRDLALWLAFVYDEYKYFDSPVDDFFELARMIFGQSCAYEKLEALNETLNRSTAYILPRLPDEKENKKICRKKLFEMVFMIIDSYSDEIYESSRIDIQHK